jgi:hypothetical protein
MNGNYGFVRQIARDKQDSYAREAREHRLAKQAGRPRENHPARTSFADASYWLKQRVTWLAGRTAANATKWSAIHRPRTATH